jgi:hypothetical protein
MTCFASDTLILMGDLSWKQINEVEVGEFVISMSGKPVEVLENKPVRVSKGRRMMSLHRKRQSKPLRFSDDHDMWIRDDNGVERWGVYNYNWWLLEDRGYAESSEEDFPGENPYDYEHIGKATMPLLYGEQYEFATIDGWEKTEAVWDSEQDPEEIIYGLLLKSGGGYIVDGFVGISQWCRTEDIQDIQWKGLP